MATPHDPKAELEARRDAIASAEAALTARSDRISSGRGVTFILAGGGAVAAWFVHAPTWAWWAVGVAALAFVALVIRHARYVNEADVLKSRRGVVTRGLARIAHDWSALGDGGERFAKPVDEGGLGGGAAHPYAHDLDVLGRASLVQLISTARTADGERRLAGWLLTPASPDVLRERQAAARELAEKASFREDLEHLAAATRTAGKARDPLFAWANEEHEGTPLHLNVIAKMGRVLPVITVASLLVTEVLTDVPGFIGRAWMVTMVLQLIVLGLLRAPLGSALSLLRASEAPFAGYLDLVKRIEDETFSAPVLVRAHAELTGASAALKRLARVLSFAEVRHNALAAFTLDALLAWDLFTGMALARWRDTFGPRVEAWVAAMAELEALASLGAVTFENPTFTFPDVAEDGLAFDADALAHPLLPADKRVANDVRFGDAPRALLVTGSNMSGKSTLLRAIGVNAVLAFAGAPCCAKRVALGPARVWTSMRVTDSLDSGVSHFYAELARLKQVVDARAAGEPVLFLLDEVMHGTNSRERQIGAKALALHLVEAGAVGALTSHDLGLGELEEESAGAIRAVHFEEQVDDGKMTFDYKLKPGVVRSGNALRLMRELGLPVPPE